MITAKVKLTGLAPLSMSRKFQDEKNGKETAKDFEKRIWRERLNYNDDGNVILPGIMVKNCISETAKYLGERIEGKNRQTWTKHFESGITVESDIEIEAKKKKIKKNDVKGEWLFVPSNGQKGGGLRVDKCFPKIDAGWTGEIDIIVLDESITRDVFERHLKEAGRFVGVGRWRPRVGGMYGRFKADVVSWSKTE